MCDEKYRAWLEADPKMDDQSDLRSTGGDKSERTSGVTGFSRRMHFLPQNLTAFLN